MIRLRNLVSRRREEQRTQHLGIKKAPQQLHNSSRCESKWRLSGSTCTSVLNSNVELESFAQENRTYDRRENDDYQCGRRLHFALDVVAQAAYCRASHVRAAPVQAHLWRPSAIRSLTRRSSGLHRAST